ncbi:MAG: tRNA pseudouridine(38-40) synthase TruA [Candidatus Eremiobacteraeota bacterium]|nr:tRNA pseudouridine(38-40) synthase TruA [Candidatus Eremiobacteraeota bacterium]
MRAVVEYDGTNFWGMQVQPRGRTIAGELERALAQLFGSETKISSAGRTDTGVHATGQVISFKTNRAFPFDRLPIAMNTALDDDVSVREAAVVEDGFSARFSAVERAYVYAILNRAQRSALTARSAYHVYTALDLERMREAAASLVGEHDFRSFCGMLPQSGPTVRNVREIIIDRYGEFVRLQIAADGFLHRMVRAIVGTLVECGTGRREPQSFSDILVNRDRSAAGHTAPPHGLYLAGVKYRDGFDSYKEPALFSNLRS